MRLLELPDDVLEMISAGTLSEGHGRALLQASGQDERVALAKTAVTRGWSVRDLEVAAKRAGRAKPAPKRAPGAMDDELSHLVVDAAWQSLALRAGVRRGPRVADGSRSTSRRPPNWAESSINFAGRTRLLGGLNHRWYSAVPRAISSVG